ncbi:MAG: hypothetical protein P4L03_01150 [Terracidiphilus sp.]|nr:hypothetical protein [Terracidiphilus sp.]
MSNLEIETQPILIPLLNGQRKASSLTIDERLVLARWTFKTSLMLLESQNRVINPIQLLRTWYKNGLQHPTPSLVFALTESAPSKAFVYIIEEDEFNAESNPPKNIRIAIYINSLLLVILIPTDELPRVPGAVSAPQLGDGFVLLWPNDINPVSIPLTKLATPPQKLAEWIRFIAHQVGAGIPKKQV